MAQQKRIRPVQLTAVREVEIGKGVVLPPGHYAGTSKQIGLETYQGVSWTNPSYHLELSAEQFESMGGRPSDRLISTEYDLTKFVSSGDISVS
jgi:hypothetical protein